MSKTLEKEGPSICARKTWHTHCHSPTAVATTESTLLDPQLETFAPVGRWCQHTKCAPASSKWTYLVVGVARSVYKWLGGKKNWQDREQWQNLFSRKCENLYKEKFHTPRKYLAEHPIEVHSSVFFLCHQNRMTTGGQWTPKSKGSFFVTCHYSETKVVSFFMQHMVFVNTSAHLYTVKTCARAELEYKPQFFQTQVARQRHLNGSCCFS